jgi:hypothetical protein
MGRTDTHGRKPTYRRACAFVPRVGALKCKHTWRSCFERRKTLGPASRCTRRLYDRLSIPKGRLALRRRRWGHCTALPSAPPHASEQTAHLGLAVAGPL